MLLKQKKFIVFFLLLAGCTSISAPPHNLISTVLKDKAATRISQAKNYDISSNQTFTILPAKNLVKNNLSKNNTVNLINDEVTQMHLLFILRNALEGRGYKFVSTSEKPDFIATIETSVKHTRDYFTPSINKRTKWQLNDLVTSELKTKINWGTYLDAMKSSGNESLKQNTPQGLSGGIYYPQIDITLFDKKTMSAKWHGVAVGASDNPIIQISSQLIVRSLISQIALSTSRFKNFPINTGKIGLGYAIVTTDGKNYYPAVTGLLAQAPAKEMGLKNTDYITEINGDSTRNKSTAKIASMLTGAAKSSIKLKTWRMGSSLELSVKRVQR